LTNRNRYDIIFLRQCNLIRIIGQKALVTNKPVIYIDV